MRIFESDANNKNSEGDPKSYLRLLPIVFEQQPRDIYWNWVLPEEENTC